ncbi:uncharacterized protein PG986_014707 [Apiospora aurea]|uniref:Hemerythrin-like domain-containing protein n=1 Tax=Apiospora aurea TaxID=335848 RepID=A0ABR1PUP8_9PEZI
MKLSGVRPLIRAFPSQSALASAYKPMSTRIASLSTIGDAITKDHRELRKYYNEVVLTDDADHRARYGNQFTWELARHSIAEELVVYPAMEEYMGAKGKHLADDDRAQHHRVKELLKEYQNLRGDDPNHVPKIKELWQVLSQHIKEEEEKDLPELEQAIRSADGEGESERLAKTFERTKYFVPTRSHPSAGENPVFESVMGLMATPMDKLADMFRKFPKEEDSLANWNKDAP